MLETMRKCESMRKYEKCEKVCLQLRKCKSLSQNSVAAVNYKIDLKKDRISIFVFFQLTKKMRATLSKTKFKDAPIVPVAAKPATTADEKENSPIGECPLILSHKYQITAQSFHPKKGYATDNFFSRYH